MSTHTLPQLSILLLPFPQVCTLMVCEHHLLNTGLQQCKTDKTAMRDGHFIFSKNNFAGVRAVRKVEHLQWNLSYLNFLGSISVKKVHISETDKLCSANNFGRKFNSSNETIENHSQVNQEPEIWGSIVLPWPLIMGCWTLSFINIKMYCK